MSKQRKNLNENIHLLRIKEENITLKREVDSLTCDINNFVTYADILKEITSL